MPKQDKSDLLPGAAISGVAVLSPDGLTLSIHGMSGFGTPLLAQLGKKKMYLPGATIVNIPPYAKYVSWNGESYSLHAEKPSITAKSSAMFIGRIRRAPLRKVPEQSGINAPITEQRQDKLEEIEPKKYQRFPASVYSPSAAAKMEGYMKLKAMGQTEFAIQAETTDKTIRKFRQTGKIKRSILGDIAKAMGISREELLK